MPKTFQTKTIPQNAEAIEALTPAELSEAACLSLAALNDAGGGVLDGALELMDLDQVRRLRDILWEVHLIPHIDRVPRENPYAAMEAHVLQELASTILSHAIDKSAEPTAMPASMFAGVGDTRALDIVTTIEDWETRYQHEEAIGGP